jgi:hypothetical protein
MGQPGGLAHRPGGSSLVQDATRRGASDAPAPGKRTLVEQAPIGPGTRGGPAAPAGGAAASGLGDWVGAGKAGEVFQNATTEVFVDGATKDALELQTRWALAEFQSYELGTDAVMEVERTIHIRLARGSWILVRSRARAWFHADRLPNDVHAALHAPAKRVKHEGSIVVTDDKGLRRGRGEAARGRG